MSERSTVERQQELEAIAKAIIDSNHDMTLGTADESGPPWVSPVWYARADFGWTAPPRPSTLF